MRAEQPVGAPLLEFLRRARRRYLTRELLGAAFASAATSLLLELAIVLVDRRFGWDVPVVSIGIVLFAVLGALVLRRNRVARVAERADRGLRLQDRLATFLDFHGRADVSPDFRRAQAGEASAALSRTDLARGIPIPRLLWAAPLLFGWMLYLDYFTFFVPFTPPFLQQIVRVVDPHRAAPRTGDAPEDGDAGEKGGREASTAPHQDRPAAAPGETPPAAPGDARQPGGEDRPDDPGAADAGDQGERLAAIPAIISEPARLYSEPVGKSLTPVADAAPGASPVAPPALPELPLRGRISFNLVPVDGGGDGPAGKGTEPGGGTTEGLEVTIDYDAVPPEYRTQVRRYFNALVRLFQGGNDGT
jgi:hypothetical protein